MNLFRIPAISFNTSVDYNLKLINDFAEQLNFKLASMFFLSNNQVRYVGTAQIN